MFITCQIIETIVKKKLGLDPITNEAENLCLFSDAEVEMIRSLVEKKA